MYIKPSNDLYTVPKNKNACTMYMDTENEHVYLGLRHLVCSTAVHVIRLKYMYIDIPPRDLKF